jgi:hypothetical protein
MSAQRVPRAADVLRMQLKLLIATKYVGVVVVLPVIGLTALNVFNPQEGAPPWLVQPLVAFSFTGLVFTGAVAAMLAWLGESPQTRRYHWSMPVRREVHDTLRIVAGAAWLMAALAVFCAFAWFMEDEILREQWLSRASAFWLSVFLVPLLCYALVTIVALMTGKPMVWLAAVLIAIMAVGSNTVQREAPAVARAYVAVFGADHAGGLGAALTGGLLSAPWSREVEKQRVYEATAPQFFARRGQIAPPRVVSGAVEPVQPFGTAPLKVSQWLISLGVWFALALVAIAFAVRRRPDV